MFDLFDKERQEGGGGGGRARIRLGATGPRGRMHSTVRPRGGGAVVKSKFIKAGKGARAGMREHLRYIQERERGVDEPERKFFDRERSGIERPEVYDAMFQNRGDKAAMHTIILSPGDNKVNVQDYTRESMEALEERLGHKLDWYAVHTNTDHHHAHVAIAGKIPDFVRQAERQEVSRAYRKPHDSKWENEQKELRELLGPGYDERAQMDPREERRAEREFGYGMELQGVDARDRDVVGERVRYPEELKAERALDSYEWRMEAPERARSPGDVYLDRNDLNELRAAGNDYLTRERSLARELERSIDREMSHELDFDFDRTRALERESERGADEGGFGTSKERDDTREDRGRDDDGFDRGR